MKINYDDSKWKKSQIENELSSEEEELKQDEDKGDVGKETDAIVESIEDGSS